MEEVFRFKIAVGISPIVEIWVEIPMELHQRISDAIGPGKMERFEFGFHFQEIVEKQFSELDILIRQRIDEWTNEHDLEGTPSHVLHYYSLVSPWFES